MRTAIFFARDRRTLLVSGIAAVGLVGAFATASLAAAGEDSLICAKVKDSYAAAAYTAAFWPRSEAYGDMTWCDLQVKAVEHCVPVDTEIHMTTAPYEDVQGPTVQTEYTCYRIRCANGEGKSFMGSTVPMQDMFGARTGDKPRVSRVCLPDL
jgi:hypothetical protein